MSLLRTPVLLNRLFATLTAQDWLALLRSYNVFWGLAGLAVFAFIVKLFCDNTVRPTFAFLLKLYIWPELINI